ncbi:MAG: calcium/sodium antiporter [Lachnospiraceae bacterium]|nr:calcium/sodium antiporter [Lachnospiraceae bacterium]
MMYLMLVVGFVLLIKGADFFVDGSSSIARLLKIPSVVIGLTIVAMGTSAPEAAVSITAGLAGNNDIAISNIIGSNIFNLLMVVGLCAVLRGVTTDKNILRRDLPVNIGISSLLLIFLLDLKITRIEAALLLVLFTAYMIVVVEQGLKNRTEEQKEESSLSPGVSVIYIAGGLAAIIAGGNLVVDNASKIAETFGLSQNLIGLTIVAVGTSLPELVTSVIATRKGECGLALGNAVGSCVFNILFILGISGVLSPMKASGESLADISVLVVSAVLMLIFGKSRGRTSRIEGAVCMMIYAGYMVYAVVR